MWNHPAVVENIAMLKRRGVRFVEPGEGYSGVRLIGKA